jgi:hypothetical protein
MGEARRRRMASTYPTKATDMPTDDDEARRQYLMKPDVQSLLETPEAQRLMRPKLLELLAEIGVQPQVDAATGELAIDFPAVCAALGLDPVEATEQVRGQVRMVPADRLKPLQ